MLNNKEIERMSKKIARTNMLAFDAAASKLLEPARARF